VLVDESGRELTYGPDGHSQSKWVFGGRREAVRQLLDRPWDRAARSGFGEAVPPPSLAPLRAVAGRLEHNVETLRRAQGCLIGQIAGDALGALVEFLPAPAIARAYPDGGPRRLANGGPHGILAGQPTDDSELALMLARTIVANEGFDQEAIAVSYARWFHGWTHADVPEPCPHGWCQPFDVGVTTRKALAPITLDDASRGRAATVAMRAASRESQANGALMRISPLGIWGARRPAAEVADAARLDARLTHPHPVCQDASALFAVTLAAAIGRRLDRQATYAFALEWGRAEKLQPTVMQAVEAAAIEPPRDFMSTQGWVLIALQNAFFQLTHASTLESGVVATVRAGGDTDTNAAICGALLGAVHGRAAIPTQWQRMVVTCRPMVGQPDVTQPRPAIYWPVDVLVMAERLLDHKDD
jgi:ADP-ribosylglycohydrolase